MLTAASWSGALLVYFLYAYHLLLYLLPGCAAATLLERRRRLSPLVLIALLIVTAALLGYTGFWMFLWNKAAGKTFTYAVYLSSIAVIVAARKRKNFWPMLWRAVRLPLSFTLLAGWLYLSLLCLYGDPAKYGAGLANQRFFDEERPGDNLIPLIFAGRIYGGLPLQPFCCGGWLSSDRPPLQTGIVVLLRPLRVSRNEALNYQSLSTALQCLWIFGACALLESCGVTAAQVRRVLALLVFSGFLCYNSVFVWPKLLAASLLLLSLSFLVRTLRDNTPIYWFDASLAGISLGLALMAHPGSIFSLPAVALAICYRRRLFPWRSLTAAAAIPVLFLLSWSFYQRHIDPPGNRLVKMHLAGVFDIDKRTFPQALRDSYHSASWSTIASNKWSNIRHLMGPLNLTSLPGSRTSQRDYIPIAVGLLNVGWLGLLAGLVRRIRQPELRPLAWLTAAAAFDFLLWSLVLFGPMGTSTTASSYADILLLAVPLATFTVITLPVWVTWLTVSLQAINLLLVWSYSPRQQVVAAFLSGALALSALLIVLAFRRSPAD